jgi:hypothetical protein
MLVGVAVTVSPARAGIFSKHKVNPADRVPTLIATLRAEPDEHKRVSAAEELRQYDPSMFPEIIPTLADAASRDSKSSVRLEAIQSLAKLRPVSQRAGSALEQATHDESMRVRLQARTLLWQYHLAGYHGGKTPDISEPTNTIRTEEPPLAPPLEANRGSKIEDRGSSAELPTSTFIPRSSILEPRSAPAPSAKIVASQPTAPSPTVGYVAPVVQSAPKANVWGATSAPKTMPSQPTAVPQGPRPMPMGPAQTSASGPRPLPMGPEITRDNGPKPLPSGPADATKPSKAGTTKEPPIAAPMDDGPDLSPP